MSVTYFCLEYAIEDNLPIYAGGLGVLAGDLVLEAGQQDLDFVAMGLFYNHGFSEKQEIDPQKSGFALESFTVPVEIGSEEMVVKVWSKKYGSARLFLLDAGELTKFLYGPNQATMLKQQVVLGVGGVRLLRQLNINPTVYHLNEGHSAMAILELARESNWDFEKAGQKVVATKHTIFSGAGLHLTADQLRSALTLYSKKYHLDFDQFFSLGTHKDHPEIFATAKFLLRFARKQSGVSKIHVAMEKQVHPDSTLIPITNGINVARWDQFATKKPNDILTLVWARRFTAYKRPELLFTNPARLKSLPIKIILAGKTNPADTAGQEMLNHLKVLASDKVTLIEGYSLSVAKKLVASADVWLNTPIPGQEACGTSGMKAGLNGALMLSTNDGWMAEVNWDGLGWILPEENITEVLYDTLEKEIVPLYYDNKEEWQHRCQKTRELILDRFTTARVLNEYQGKLYLA